jgi:threonine synthase
MIASLPLIVGVQSRHANPVYLWRQRGSYAPVAVRSSVAQAAMIGNPVSFPKVRRLVEEHFRERFVAVEVTEQEIMDAMLTANRHGHVICTQGGEGVAGLAAALRAKAVEPGMRVVVDSTAHQLKFADFQQKYFDGSLPADYEVTPRRELQNRPVDLPASATAIAEYLNLSRRA